MEHSLYCDRCGRNARRFLTVGKQSADDCCPARQILVTECRHCDGLTVVCAAQWVLLVPPWPGMVLAKRPQLL
jgi:hypothetical protein